MKLKRKSGLTAGIIALSAVAITSVGFASWVISAGDKAEVTGSIEVDDVTDDSHSVLGVYDNGIETTDGSKLSTSSNQKIQFGAPVNDHSTGWLTYSDLDDHDDYLENLTAVFYVSVLNGSVAADSFTVANYVKAGFEVKEAGSPASSTQDGLTDYAGFAGALSLHLVNLPTVSVEKITTSATISAIEGHTSETEPTAAHSWFKVTVTFSWGSLFGVSSTNPYVYYNNMLSNADIGGMSASAHAKKYLTALDELLAGVTYKFTFKTYANSTEKSADTGFATGDLLVVDAD